jgi:hypothetical protein
MSSRHISYVQNDGDIYARCGVALYPGEGVGLQVIFNLFLFYQSGSHTTDDGRAQSPMYNLIKDTKTHC